MTLDTLTIFSHSDDLVRLNRVEDYLEFARLADDVGPAATATSLATREGDLVSNLVRRLGAARPRIRAGSAGPRPSPQEWSATTAVCQSVAAHLICDHVTVPSQPVEPALAIDEGGIDEWRRLLAPVRRDPWGPEALQLSAALDAGRDRGAVGAIRAAAALARKQVEREEQLDVASRVAEYLKMSGLTQRAFSARIGTSPSRLSTYVNGSVTPSAAMMLRIAKVATHLSRPPLPSQVSQVT